MNKVRQRYLNSWREQQEQQDSLLDRTLALELAVDWLKELVHELRKEKIDGQSKTTRKK